MKRTGDGKENSDKQNQGMKNTNSMSTGSQEKNNENSLKDSNFHNTNYAYNRFIEIPNFNNPELEEKENDYIESETKNKVEVNRKSKQNTKCMHLDKKHYAKVNYLIALI
jgi:hypothetical protein